jgi:hypothetical protein
MRRSQLALAVASMGFVHCSTSAGHSVDAGVHDAGDASCVLGLDVCVAAGGQCVVHKTGASTSTCPLGYGPTPREVTGDACILQCEGAGSLVCCALLGEGGGEGGLSGDGEVDGATNLFDATE